jgi:tRNA A37 threonylcarbamoyladenosine synthetase subunit TsaC/SUA5/YrdC
MAQFFEVHPANPQPRLIRQAATILRAGGVIAYPTDSSYALGLPHRRRGLRRGASIGYAASTIRT